MAIVGFMTIMFGQGASIYNTALQSNKKLEELRMRETQIERVSDKIRSFAKNFTGPVRISSKIVLGKNAGIKIKKNTILFVEKEKSFELMIPKDTTVFFKEYRNPKKHLLLTTFDISKEKKSKTYTIKTYLENLSER